jgi:uncharacterized protein YcbK (DUF882 family)
MCINLLRTFHFLIAIIFVLIVGVGDVEACVPYKDDGSFDCAGYTASSGACPASEYLDSLCVTESGCNYNCGQTGGLDDALGKYQFIPGTRQGLCQSNAHLPCVSAAAFANCPALQEAYITTFNEGNIAALKSCGAWDKAGSTVNGVEVTQSCLLAAAHLGGAQGACGFMSGGNPCDKLGTCLSTYCDKHGGKDITPGSGSSAAGGGECEIPEQEEEEDPEIPPVAACGKGPGVAVCDMPPCSIGTPTGFCVPVTPTPQPPSNEDDEDEEEEQNDSEICQATSGGIPYEMTGALASNGAPTSGQLNGGNLDDVCRSPDGALFEGINCGVLESVEAIQGCLQDMGHAAETLEIISCFRSEAYDKGRGSYLAGSQHQKGTAMDLAFSGVSSSDLHTCALQVRDELNGGNGGIGTYSGANWIHFDVRDYKADWAE